MDEEFDSIESQIGELNEILGDSLESDDLNLDLTEPPETESENDRTKEIKYSRMGQIILRLLDGDLEQRYFLRFEKWLIADIDALRYYIQFIQLCAGLQILYGKKFAPANLESVSTK